MTFAALSQITLQLHDAAVTVFDSLMSPLAWNAVADAMFHWSRHGDEFESNGVVAGLKDPYYKTFFGADYEAVARGTIGLFRRGYHTGTPSALAQRIFQYGMTQPLFRTVWEEATARKSLRRLRP